MIKTTSNVFVTTIKEIIKRKVYKGYFLMKSRLKWQKNMDLLNQNLNQNYL